MLQTGATAWPCLPSLHWGILTPPAGCAFHTRCPIAMPLCRQQLPALKPHAKRLAACHALEVSEAATAR
ncbi:MAG: hypothetical protein HS128_04255 [Ideonella sp.]|nr:hypothetical protein [Ideonella sp.]MCC7455801.1 hypothetical protein [Nitrospira sp.]